MTQHTDPEYADPLAGSGISEDNYGEESWAGESPWQDPHADELTEELDKDEGGRGSKKNREATYQEERDGARASSSGEEEYNELTRRPAPTPGWAGVPSWAQSRPWGEWLARSARRSLINTPPKQI